MAVSHLRLTRKLGGYLCSCTVVDSRLDKLAISHDSPI